MKVVKQELSSREKRVLQLKRISQRAKHDITHSSEREANNIVYWAKKWKILPKPEKCSECNTERNLHYHHDDYAFPLDVRALCASCHKQWHKSNTALNADLPLRLEFLRVVPRFMFETRQINKSGPGGDASIIYPK